ncbi:MAG: DUF6089 family protein [Saprospiraceae bacterium]|nr:DUF6089 family protein [Saprospiraceae bacterium]
MKKIVIILFVLFLGFGNVQSQDIEVGFFGGVSYYVGDINPGMPFVQSKSAYGVLARYNLNTRMALKFNYYRGKIAGDDAITNAVEDRDLAFESSINDFSAIFEFHFLPYFIGSKRSYFTPYIFGGASMFTYNPKLGDIVLRDMGTEGQNQAYNDRKPYSKVSFAIPFGIGFKYSLTKKIGLGIEWGLRKTFTDYLDDVSTTYYLDGPSIDPNDAVSLLSDPGRNHEVGMQRGNSKTKDWYSFTGITITYKFDIGNRAHCLDQPR